MRVSWAPPDVSSTRVRIGRRRLVRKVSPTAGTSFRNHARLASIAITSGGSAALNAQVSTTWTPWVLTTRTCWPARTRAALPRRAGIVTRSATRRVLGAAQRVAPVIVGHRQGPPLVQQGRIGLPDLDPEGAAHREGVGGIGAPHRHREIPVRAHGDRAEHVDLREAFEIVALPRRARLDEVAAVCGEAGDLEDVEHVVDGGLGEAESPDGPDEVRVAAEVELLAVQELVHVGITARAEEIVAPGAVPVDAIPDGVGGDGQERPQIGETRPQPVERGEMRLMELARARGPEALARVGEAPHVEVGHLGALDGDDTKDLSRANRPRAARPARRDEALDERAVGVGGEPAVEGPIHLEGRARLRLVDHAW